MRHDLDGRPLPPHAPFPRSRFAPPASPAERTRQPRCSKCGQELIWIEMERTGKRMPCDPGQRYGDGRRHLVTRRDVHGRLLGRMIARAGADVLGFEPHFGTCRNRQGVS